MSKSECELCSLVKGVCAKIIPDCMDLLQKYEAAEITLDQFVTECSKRHGRDKVLECQTEAQKAAVEKGLVK